MNQSELTYLLNHPSQVSEEHLTEISEILEAFPYFQAPRVIQLKGLKNIGSFKYNDELKRTAAHTVDRSVLFNFITNFSFDEGTSNAVIIEQIEVIDSETVEPTEEIIPIEIEAEAEIETNVASETKIQIEPETKEASPESILELGKPIQFQKHEPHSFNEWMQLISKKPIRRTAIPKVETPVKKSNKLDLIERFIETNPKIKPVKKTTEIKDVSKESSEQNESLMTETLAKVYVEQKKYDNAIQAYRILSLKYPEKSVFFADRIKAITILQRNKS